MLNCYPYEFGLIQINHLLILINKKENFFRSHPQGQTKVRNFLITRVNPAKYLDTFSKLLLKIYLD